MQSSNHISNFLPILFPRNFFDFDVTSCIKTLQIRIKNIRPVAIMNDLKSICFLFILLASSANCRPQEENLVEDNVNKVEKEITITGD